MTASSAARVLFICGSINQTSQLVAVAKELEEVEASFSPFYGDRLERWLVRLGLAENTIGGHKLMERCLRYLEQRQLRVDYRGARGPYDLFVTCTDLVIPTNTSSAPVVVVQEGIMDPDGILFEVVRRFPHHVPRWIAGTSATGLSGAYEKFCTASEGYKEYFIERGAPAERLVVTGIPNFDNCESFLNNDFPQHDYALIISSDTRETVKLDSRGRFMRWASNIVGDRHTLIRLHPNENVKRSAREYRRYFPKAEIHADGPTDWMIANASVVVTQYSSCAFVALALGKEVYSYFDVETLRRLLPIQNRCAASNIAEVCRQVLWPDSALRVKTREAAE